MIAGFLLALREGLEAALIIGIVLGTLRKTNRDDLRPVVWLGVGSAALTSAALGIIFYLVGISFSGRGEAIFEGITMLLAAGVLTWMIFWMNRNSRQVSLGLENEVRQATQKEGKRAIFLVSFLAVVREGIELALFLLATAFAAGAQATLVGALLGLAASIGLAWFLFASLIKLNVRRFFQVTSIVLIFVAAGLVAHGVHELNEAHVIPEVIEHVWDMNHLLDEDSFVGQLMKTLFGYNGNPSFTEVVAYLSYFGAVLFGLWWQRNKEVVSPPPELSV